MHLADTPYTPPPRQPLYRQLYFQVIVAIVLGALLGHFEPAFAESMKPLPQSRSETWMRRQVLRAPGQHAAS